MSPVSPRYFLMEDGRRTGPHTLAVLCQKAEIRVIDRETLVAFEDEPEAWLPLRECEGLSAGLFPEKAVFTLAAKTIESVNTTTPTQATSVHEMLRSNLARQEAAAGELLKPLPPRSNRRKQDFWILFGALNLAVGLLAFRLPMNPMVFVSIIALFTLGNISLVWVMFFVMDRY
ncbi:MAG: DUF4339 domain-containing protein [Verrucomicrobia bacterium]|nr:DUF4339 domain-containing protein [Verrucomicrobiota bacterium]